MQHPGPRNGAAILEAFPSSSNIAAPFLGLVFGPIFGTMKEQTGAARRSWRPGFRPFACASLPSAMQAAMDTHTDPYSIVKKKKYIIIIISSHILLYIFNYIFLYIIFSYCCYYYILYIWGPISIHKSHHSPAKTYELTIFGAHDAINCHKSQQLIRVSRSHLLRLRLLLRLPGACWSALRGDRRRPWRPATQRPWRKWRTRRSGQGSPGVTMETRAVNRCIWACWWYFVA